MKTKFGILIAYVLSILLILHYPITVLAESGTNQGGAYTNGADTSTADKQQFSVKNDGLEFTVTYPKTIQCGIPTTFEFDAKYDNDSNVSNGEFKYRIHSLTVYDGFENVSVYDVSYGLNSQYTSQNTFNFTFYASGTYYIRFEACYRTPNPDGQTYKMITVNTGFLNEGIVLNINDSRYPSVENIVANIANECLKQCSTDYEKALWLNDWIVDHCQYDNTFSYCSAEGALARGTGTCEAYHRAYVMLLNRVGISTGRITGNGHVWTAVKMNGKWYQVDTTWNDPGYPEPNIDLRHLYFGLNDEIMKKVHSDHTPVQGYESTSLEQNYFIQSKEILKWANPVINKVREHITARDTSFSIEINKKNSNDSDYASSYATILYNLVSHVLTNMSWSDNEALNINLNAVYNPVDSSSGSIECTVQYDTIPLSFQQVSLATDSVNIGTNAQLSYAVNRNATVTVQVFDTNHQCLQTLVSNKVISTEEQVVQWNLKNNAGTYVPNGSYHFTITAKDSFGNSLVKHKYFNVYSPLKSIALNYTNLTMDKGNQKQLSVSYNPSNTTDSKSITWSSSNSSIAKVNSNGQVTGINPGTATIYAKCNGKMASCSIFVNGYIQNDTNNEDLNQSISGVWQIDNTGWWFRYPNGLYPRNTWEKINGYWYWFNNRGYMVVGWQQIGGTWYYLKPSGAMATGWQLINGYWYYLKPSGAMAAKTWIGNCYVNERGVWVP